MFVFSIMVLFFPEAKAAVDKEWSKLKSLTAWDDKEVKPKAAVVAKVKV